MRKQNSMIKITEDVRVPGTDVILEAGDRIEVLTERQVMAGFDIAFDIRGDDYSDFLSRVQKEYNLDIERIVRKGPTGWPYVVFSGSYSDLERFSDIEMGDDLSVFLL